jgi:hypothetical protein
MKKDYLKPAMKVYKLRQPCRILSGSPQVGAINTNLGDDGFIWGGAGGEDKPAN